MPENKKIYFISDVHLGAPALKNNAEREKLLANWLDSIKNDVKELYLLGDIFDFWFEYKKVVPRGFTRILGRIADLTDSGIPVHYFTGNHDLWVFDYLPEETGVTVHRDFIIKEYNGKKFFLAHGDGLDESDKGYNRLKKIFVNKKMQWLFSRIHPNAAFYLAHSWSKSSRLSKMGTEVQINVKNEGIFKFAEGFLKQKEVDYFIFGHRHLMTIEKIGENSKFVYLGDWINNFSFGVFDGDKFELKRFKK